MLWIVYLFTNSNGATSLTPEIFKNRLIGKMVVFNKFLEVQLGQLVISMRLPQSSLMSSFLSEGMLATEGTGFSDPCRNTLKGPAARAQKRERKLVYGPNPLQIKKDINTLPAAPWDGGVGIGQLPSCIDSVSSHREEPLLTHSGADLPGRRDQHTLTLLSSSCFSKLPPPFSVGVLASRYLEKQAA